MNREEAEKLVFNLTKSAMEYGKVNGTLKPKEDAEKRTIMHRYEHSLIDALCADHSGNECMSFEEFLNEIDSSTFCAYDGVNLDRNRLQKLYYRMNNNY